MVPSLVDLKDPSEPLLNKTKTTYKNCLELLETHIRLMTEGNSPTSLSLLMFMSSSPHVPVFACLVVEDFVRPWREGVAELCSEVRTRGNISEYTGVTLVGLGCWNGVVMRIEFDHPYKVLRLTDVVLCIWFLNVVCMHGCRISNGRIRSGYKMAHCCVCVPTSSTARRCSGQRSTLM